MSTFVMLCPTNYDLTRQKYIKQCPTRLNSTVIGRPLCQCVVVMAVDMKGATLPAVTWYFLQEAL